MDTPKGVEDKVPPLELDLEIKADKETPAAPPAEKAPEVPAVVTEVPATKTDEELEFAKLRGGTQERIRELIVQRNTERDRATQLEAEVTKFKTAPSAEQTPTPQSAVERQKALEYLESFGLLTNSSFDKKLQELDEKRTVDGELANLEKKYDGSNGLPKFMKDEVIDHMKKTQIWHPEKAFKDLYEEEWIDHKIKERDASGSKQPEIIKGKSMGTQPVTAETIAERLRQPDGREWYNKNIEAINKILPSL